LLASATSIGANLEEAEAAHSHPDFVVKNSNALKEAREIHYWLRLLQACRIVPAPRVASHLAEADEIIRIITAIRKNAGHRSRESKA
jgi:four helix bundle protein